VWILALNAFADKLAGAPFSMESPYELQPKSKLAHLKQLRIGSMDTTAEKQETSI
jgi:hypothetical protein